MSKRADLANNSTRTDNTRPREAVTNPPTKSQATAPINASAAAAPRASDLKLLSGELLEALTGSVKASAGIVRILPAKGQTLQVISSIGLPAEMVDARNAGDYICKECGKDAIGNEIYYADIADSKAQHDCIYAGGQIRSVIVASIGSARSPDISMGTITLFFNEPPDSIEQASKNARAFARMLGTLIEQNRSNREAKRVDLLAERQYIANEIHDSLAQTLVYARMRENLLIDSIRTGNELMAEKYAHEIDETLESCQKTVRELITDFRCEMDPAGLLHAIQLLTEQFRERNDIALEYVNRVADLDLPLEYEIQVFYIVREALANIAIHSGATHARLIIDAIGDKYVFTIEDDGIGGCTFTPVEGHYGMMIMRERAARINGEIRIESTEGMGTTVQLTFQDTVVREERD